MRGTPCRILPDHPAGCRHGKLIKYLGIWNITDISESAIPAYNARGISDALKELGVKSGMKLVVHSAMSSLGTFDGGAEAFCRILTEVVGHSERS